MNAHIERVQLEIEPYRQQLLEHPVYQRISSLEDLNLFTEFHVYAVWDFMSLLKALQRGLTCVEVPWFPSANPKTRRLINDIVREEESDMDENGNIASHFELYIEAMNQTEADTQTITNFLIQARQAYNIKDLIKTSKLEPSIQQFLNFTFEVIENEKMHEIASAFTFGREDLIPGMFTQIVNQLNENFPGKLGLMKYYLDRHIQLDEGVHSHLALEMIEELCGNDEKKWNEVIDTAKKALTVRIELWNGIEAAIQQKVLN